ncbi:hypothetical protein G6L37_34835 [Agrobacterium rubi]|nr:hypothetical protein [Agrobacterium rubi]NTF23745.1 hypothetical protein [Agrobacterium rubi]
MTRLTRYIETVSDRSRLALATAGVLGTLLGVPVPAEAGNFLQKLAGELNYGQQGTYRIGDARTAAAFNVRITENLSDLVQLSRSMQRIDLYGQFSGRETANKIKQAYLYEYSQAPYAELRQYDRMSLAAAPGTGDRRVALIVADANQKKAVLRDGTTLVDEIANALVREDYRRVERLVAQFGNLMENRAVPLIQRQQYQGQSMANADEQPDFGMRYGR